MEPIERLLAIEDIKQLKARYCRHVDAKDWAAYRELFLVDAHLEYGAGAWDDADAMVEFFSRMLADASTVHHGHMPEIDIVAPDQATGTWTIFDRVQFPEGSALPSTCGYGRYWETYRKVDDRWYIASLRIEWFHRLPLDGG